MTLLSLDPRALTFAANVRTEVSLSREFIASVRERGVLQPVVAYPGVEGPVVEFGHRRTLAALKCGLPNIPVMLVEVPEGADRVTDQLVENDQRAGLSTAERVAGWEQLAAFGLSASAIAKRTGAKKTDVTTGLKVAGSE
ncbi:ParB/RepB/Spo0J family partition protein, partial [Pseudonocardia oroxyli]